MIGETGKHILENFRIAINRANLGNIAITNSYSIAIRLGDQDLIPRYTELYASAGFAGVASVGRSRFMSLRNLKLRPLSEPVHPPCGRGNAHHLAEGPAKMHRIREAGGCGNVLQAAIGVQQQILGPLDTGL